jgi:hypothetical protein
MLTACSDPDFQRHLNEMAYGAAAGAQAGAAAHATYVDEPRERALDAAALSKAPADEETRARLDEIEQKVDAAVGTIAATSATSLVDWPRRGRARRS